MYKNAFKCIFGLHIHTYAHICILLHEDATILDNCTHNYAYGNLVMDTRVLFLQSARLQVTHKIGSHSIRL